MSANDAEKMQARRANPCGKKEVEDEDENEDEEDLNSARGQAVRAPVG